MFSDITAQEVEILNMLDIMTPTGVREVKEYMRYILTKQYRREVMAAVFHNKLLSNLFHSLLF